MNVFKIIAVVATLVMLIFGLVGNGPNTYRFAILFLGPLLWAVYYYRDKLCLHPIHFAVFASAMVLHDLGAFGAYRKSFLGLEFDMYVHFYFGMAGALMVAPGLQCHFRLVGWKLWIGVILLVMGVGALHELMEYATTLVLGPEKGMLKANDPDKFDTQKDLLNNLSGTILALALNSLFSRKKDSRPSPSA
ncbi:MAG: DUF2238 domain-containing protein [Verrucomicrobiales bacterium]